MQVKNFYTIYLYKTNRKDNNTISIWSIKS